MLNLKVYLYYTGSDGGMTFCVCVGLCVCARMRAFMRACACECEHVRVSVRACVHVVYVCVCLCVCECICACLCLFTETFPPISCVMFLVSPVRTSNLLYHTYYLYIVQTIMLYLLIRSQYSDSIMIGNAWDKYQAQEQQQIQLSITG